MRTSAVKSQIEQMSDEMQELMELAREEVEEVEEVKEEVKHRMNISDVLSVPEKAPSGFYLGMAAGSIVFSLILYGFKRKDDAIFVGHWAPTFLALGLFAKLLRKKK
ncbi:MAG: hypothetical protein NT018_04510 [Armatimonadetes bacterium]|nr:hypothetical protein [Armatimonadota bacterium]